MIYRLFLTLTLLFTANVAFAFAIELDFDPRGLDIVAEPFAQGPVALVRIINGEDFPVVCRAVFRNGPEASRQRQAIVAPGGSTTMSWSPRRQVVRLRVGLHCERRE